MKEQWVVGGQVKSKFAGGKARKYCYDKWSFNGVFASQKPYYKPPVLQDQSSLKTNNKKQRFYPQKTPTNVLHAPDAPRNTTSYIIRAKNSGGIAPCINTPSPPAPASVGFVTLPYKEGIVEQVNQEWGVDSYGSMKGLLRVRHTNKENREDEDNNHEPDLDKCLQVLEEKLEQKLDQDLSRFELVYPSNSEIGPRILEIRINDQDNQIAHLEEESTNLKERVFCMEQELHNLKLRMQILECADALRLGEICSGEASFS
eukprot:Gb_10637 [translate_table: standard]